MKLPKVNPEEKHKIREVIKKKNEFKHGILTLEIDKNKFYLQNNFKMNCKIW